MAHYRVPVLAERNQRFGASAKIERCDDVKNIGKIKLIRRDLVEKVFASLRVKNNKINNQLGHNLSSISCKKSLFHIYSRGKSPTDFMRSEAKILGQTEEKISIHSYFTDLFLASQRMM